MGMAHENGCDFAGLRDQKQAHWVQISRPSNHGLDVVSHPIWKGVQHIVIIHLIYIRHLAVEIPVFFRLKLDTRAKVSAIAPCIPLILQLGSTRRGRGLDSVRISSRS